MLTTLSLGNFECCQIYVFMYLLGIPTGTSPINRLHVQQMYINNNNSKYSNINMYNQTIDTEETYIMKDQAKTMLHEFHV
jgi:hypothetical protein